MYFSGKNTDEIEMLLHKALNLVETIDIENCFIPRAKALVITKIEEALMWLQYEGGSATTENQRGIK
jgi:hypothetical protein